MKYTKKLKKILILLFVFATVFLMGCVNVNATFSRDGAGSCIVTIKKEEDVTHDIVKQKVEEVIEGVKMQSLKDKLKLKSITENEDSFDVKISFMQIQGIKGLGNFTFESGTSFGSQLTQRKLLKNLSKGIISSKNLTNYDNSTYTVLGNDLKINPIEKKSGNNLNPDDFDNMENSFYKDDNIFFTYTICGFNSIENITFNFPGKILIYSDLNNLVEDSDSITITPSLVDTKKVGIKDGVAYTEEGQNKLFVGYVAFKLNTNYTPWIIAGIITTIITGLILWGIFGGFFKKFFHGKTFATILKMKALYLFILPGFLLFAVFNYMPMVGIIVAFKNYTVDGGIFGSEWAGNFGFEHFITLFTHPGSEFGLILRNTLVMALLKFITGFPAAIILALMFNALANGLFKKGVQTISYLPYFVSWVVVSNIVYLFLSSNGGIIDNIRVSMGLEKIRFYSEPKYWWGIITFTSLWKTVGWGTIVYLAAITGINPDLYEAASIDGASSWRKLWAVTLPGMMPVIAIQLILNVGNLIKDDFDQIYSLVGGSNYELRSVTEVFSSLVFRNLQGGPKGFSSSTAISLVQSIISLGLVLGANAVVKKTDNAGLW